MKRIILSTTFVAFALMMASCGKSVEYKAADAALNQYEQEIEAANDCISVGEASYNYIDISDLIYKVPDAKERNKLSKKYKKITEKALKKSNELCHSELE